MSNTQTIYLISPEYQTMAESDASSYGGTILRNNDYDVIAMCASSSGGGMSAAPTTKGNTSAIVKGIERDLGVNLDIGSDSEFRSILKKEGATPLYGMLEMVHGKEKKKASKR